MIAEIVTIGTELLLGEIVDSNAAHIARQLASIGVDHYYTTTVGDNVGRVAGVLADALRRSDAVITTGGLGPTVDDVTREAVARVTDRDLVFRPELLEQIEKFFRQRGLTMSPNNERQAYVPRNAIVVHNPVGTAPAFIVEVGSKAIICLPGVPHEMEHLTREQVLPYLSSRMGEGAVILCRMVHTVGMGESVIGEAIGELMYSDNPTVGTRAHPGQTDVCITAKARTKEEALRLLDPMEARVRRLLGSAVYGVDGETLAAAVVQGLRGRELRLAIADAVTGGLTARRLTEVDGGQSVLGEIRIALDVTTLARQMGVRLGADGAVGALAEALREGAATPLGLAIVEAPGEKPVLHVALATPDGLQVRDWPSRGRSDSGVLWALHLALDLVRRYVLSLAA